MRKACVDIAATDCVFGALLVTHSAAPTDVDANLTLAITLVAHAVDTTFCAFRSTCGAPKLVLRVWTVSWFATALHAISGVLVAAWNCRLLAVRWALLIAIHSENISTALFEARTSRVILVALATFFH
jgi:hypothetical protein